MNAGVSDREPGSVSPVRHRIGGRVLRDVRRPASQTRPRDTRPPSRARDTRRVPAFAGPWRQGRLDVCAWRARRDVVDEKVFLTFLEKSADFCRVRKGLAGRLLRKPPADSGGRKGQKVVICARARRAPAPCGGTVVHLRFLIFDLRLPEFRRFDISTFRRFLHLLPLRGPQRPSAFHPPTFLFPRSLDAFSGRSRSRKRPLAGCMLRVFFFLITNHSCKNDTLARAEIDLPPHKG